MLKIDLYEFIGALSEIVNMPCLAASIEWGVMQHNARVCYIASRIGKQMQLDKTVRSDLFYAALLHDAAMSLNIGMRRLMELDTLGDFTHCKRGHELLKQCTHTERLAEVVLHHHDKWNELNESGIKGDDIPVCSRIIFVADRVDILMRPREYILHQMEGIGDVINKHSGTYFDPQVVEAFNQVARQDSFWLDLTFNRTEELLYPYRPKGDNTLNYDQLEEIAGIFAQIVEAKNPFTLQHSRRATRVAVALAKRLKFSPFECEQIKIAGLLRDIGKLSIPDEVLNKPDKLTKDEYKIIKRHTYFTHQILRRINRLESVAQWASQHHERLAVEDPIHAEVETLHRGSRIMAASDVLTAVAEDRPSRKGYTMGKTCEILNKCVSEGALDAEVVNTVTGNIDEFHRLLELKQPAGAQP